MRANEVSIRTSDVTMQGDIILKSLIITLKESLFFTNFKTLKFPVLC